MGTVAERAELAVELAIQEWRRTVRDVSGSQDIIRYYVDGLGWTWQTGYTNGVDKWCGAFVAYCWARGGLQADIRFFSLASGGRALWWAQSTARRVKPADARAGDILLIGATLPKHIGLAVGHAEGGTIETIEGNSVGLLGDGSVGEGVVRHRRQLKGPGTHVHHAIRVLAEDLEQG